MSKYRISMCGKTYEMEVEKIDEGTGVTGPAAASSATWSNNGVGSVNSNVQVIDPSVSKETVNDHKVVRSPMPGTIIKIHVRNGDIVKKDQPVLILEAMKMENEIVAPRAGVITGLNVEEKQSIQGGIPLFEIVD